MTVVTKLEQPFLIAEYNGYGFGNQIGWGPHYDDGTGISNGTASGASTYAKYSYGFGKADGGCSVLGTLDMSRSIKFVSD